jgi:cobaltochelatase CobT
LRDTAEVGQKAWQTVSGESPSRDAGAGRLRWRGRIDALAARARYSDPDVHARLQPLSKSGSMLFSLLEQSRVETLAARAFVGVRVNLEALAEETWVRARPEGLIRMAGESWLDTFALLSRVPIGAPLPCPARTALSTSWRQWMTGAQAHAVEALASVIEDQNAYARQALCVVAAVLGQANDWQPEVNCQKQAATPAVPVATEPGLAHAENAIQPNIPQALGARDHSRTAPFGAESVHGSYHAYTRDFDQIVTRNDLCDALSLAQRRRELDHYLTSLQVNVVRWAHRLQRRLLARQARFWRFDLDEGSLDARRLTRVLTDPLAPLAYKDEVEMPFPDTVVTLLVDNSGSMRGLPIAMAAVCAELLGRVLERCGVKSEILGFTTRNWHGGRARERWVAAGKPPNPGRLTELRHIIYKTADEAWRRARSSLALMFDESLFKENVDGEALLWAHSRLARRLERRRIIVVISDGAPLDEATLEANDRGYLERHLQAVVHWIENNSPVELAAIGIGHDVTRYYRRAVTARSIEELGQVMAEQLIELLDVPVRAPLRLRH